MTPDEMRETPDEQLWALLEQVEGGERAGVLDELMSRAFDREDFEECLALGEAAAGLHRAAGDGAAAGWSVFGQARALSRLARTDEAVAAFTAAADHLRADADQADVGSCLLWAGRVLVEAGRDAEAVEHLTAAERLFAADGARESAGRAAMTLGEALGRMGRQAEALGVFGRARDQFRGHAPAPLVAWSDDRAAAALITLGRVREALDRLRACLHVAEVTKDPRNHAYAAYRLGWTLRIHGSYDEALVHLTTARELYAEREDLGGIARCDLEAAGALADTGAPDDAEHLYVRARSVFDALGADAQALLCDVNRAGLYSAAGRTDEAVAVYQAALARSRQTGDDGARFGIVTRLVAELVRAHRAAEAFDTLLTHGDGWDAMGDEVYESALRLAARARVLLAIGDMAGAHETADRGLALVGGSDFPGVRADLYEVRSGALAESDPDGSERDLAHAIALLLADRQGGRATELSVRLLPPDPEAAAREERLRFMTSDPGLPEPPGQ